MSAFGVLTAVCSVLLAALGVVSARLYALRRRETASPGSPETKSGMHHESPSQSLVEETLRVASSLQEYGVVQADAANRADFCEVFLDEICRLAGARRGWVWLSEEGKNTLSLTASTEPAPTDAPADDSPAGRAHNGQKLIVALSTGGAAVVALPLMTESKRFGILQVERSSAPEKSLQKILTLLAGEAAAILNQLQRFENLQTFHIEMVETLYRASNANDPHAGHHAAQTRGRAHRLAMAMGLTQSMTRHVEYAALLRGVGKIGIDHAILNKPGKLTAEEYEKIKKYTTIGHQLLAQVKLLAPAAKMVLYHQEWWDGRGYPEGLQGESIPLGARIIAVISAWEAMTSPRPYRKALAPSEAVAELRRAAGTQFDPAVVEAFSGLQGQETAP